MYLDIILSAPSPRFQAYDIMSCDTTCDCSHVPLHCLRKIDEKKEKCSSLSIL